MATKKDSAQKPVDKGIHDDVNPAVLESFELNHGPNTEERSDIVKTADEPKSPPAPVTPGDEGKEPGRTP